MPIKTRWILSIMLVAVLFTVGSIYFIQKFNLENDDSLYSYEEKLFNEDVVSTIEITMDEEDWEDILANPMAEEYKLASITINGETISNVAIRTKGNSSLSSVANSDSERYSLKVDFNYYDSTQSYYGLTKLNLNNNYNDSTQMKEFVSYELMEQIGVPTPAHAYMKVLVNGEYYGLMLGVEAIDETFIAQNYGTAEGYLFKPDGTGSDLIYISDALEDYSGIDVQMNEESVENSELISMIKAITEGEGYESYLNTDEMLRYFAMNTALVSLDSYQGQLQHNYYLYEDENGVFSILPWDYNESFGHFNMGMGGGTRTPMNENAVDEETEQNIPPEEENVALTERPDRSEMNQQTEQGNGEDNLAEMPQDNNERVGEDLMTSEDLLNEEVINFSIYEPVSGTTLSERPLLNVLLSDETLMEQYEAYMEQIATEILTEENVEAITTKLASLLTPYVESDPSKFYTTEQFLEGVSGDNSLPEFAKQRSESILAQLSGELVVESNTTSSLPAEIPGMDGMDGQNMERGQMQNGMVPEMNAGMRGELDINAMTDEEFAQFLEMIQSENSPITLPDNFDDMTTEEQKAYLIENMQNFAGQQEQMAAGNQQRNFDQPMLNNETVETVSGETTGVYTKNDLYLLFGSFAFTIIAIAGFRRFRR
ncbi:CotH kinase family protein [Fervidibacillus albus]|uniref:CotH kinase family protein n=1 Tax=Fervidibacillus albus TaxID=2980026 RepID=A0A9E8LU55_9BACI|nr:CotH kinase family protein [Fervidibacillus albus]WAA09576.1 CotH kinase family protein [Fervidibacillus albus]